MQIVVDSREQRPYTFERYGAGVVRGSLPTGDYSVPGLEAHVAIERKGTDDFVGCLMGSGRERFERELVRGRGLDHFVVVLEASMDDLKSGRYRSKMTPHAVLQSLVALQVRHGVPFVLAGSREGGEYMTFSVLEKYVAEAQKRHRIVLKALDPPLPPYRGATFGHRGDPTVIPSRPRLGRKS